MPVCASCGQENPGIAKFCLACGTPFPAHAPLADGGRRTVTIVFSDLVGSTALGEHLDSESLKEVMSRYFNEAQAILSRHGGVVEKFIGDAVMAVFGLPKAHEDDALRAIRAAFEMRTSLSRLNDELQLGWGVTLATRTGVNTGEVVAGDPSVHQRLVTGDAVNLAARLEQAAPHREVLLGETTYKLTRDRVVVEQVEPLRLKGKARPVPAYRLLDLVGIAGAGRTRRERALVTRESEHAAAQHALEPMVGRERELSLLKETFNRAAVGRNGQMVVIMGPPGVGKSRLVDEFLISMGDRVTVLRGRCLSYGEGITLWPFAEAARSALTANGEQGGEEELRERLGRTEEAEEIVARLGSLIGTSDRSYSVEDLLWGFRCLLQALERERPVVLVLDDVQWGEATFLDMVERIRDTTTNERLLILCLARPELADVRRAWAQDGAAGGSSILSLEPMEPADIEDFVRTLLGGLPIPNHVLERLVRAADGNPLFAEEMVGMLVDDGLLIEDDHGWTVAGDLSAVPPPPSIRALLAARLDALASTERYVLERGSVIGQVFYRGAVKELSSPDLRPRVDDGLARLEKAEYIRAYPAELAGENAFRFRHILIRDTAYEGMLKRTRAGLHEGFARWLQARVGQGETEYQEILGYHIEQAHRYLVELGPANDQARTLAVEASRYLLSAGKRARARGDSPAAVNLLSRADALWLGDDRERVTLLIDLSNSMEELADPRGSEVALSRAERAAANSNDPIARDYALIERLSVRLLNDEEGVDQAAQTEIERIQPIFEEARDYLGLSRLWALRRTLSWMRLQIAASEAAAGEVSRYAKLVGDERRRIVSLALLAQCSWLGPTMVDEALRRCDSLLDEAKGNRLMESDVRLSQAVLLAMRGEFGKARELYAIGRTMDEEMGLVINAAGAAQYAFEVEMLADNPQAAERELMRYIPLLVKIDNRWDLPTNAGMLALALYRQGRLDEALEWSDMSRKIGPPQDVDAQCRWRRARALVMAKRGEMEEADRLSREAVQLLENSDFVHAKAQLMMERAEILGQANRPKEAAMSLRQALDLFERKGNIVGAAHARKALEELGRSAES